MVNIPPPPRIDDLFKVGDDGLYYDLGDLSTLFQDAAGTVPVTSDGDPIDLMLDLSGNGQPQLTR